MLITQSGNFQNFEFKSLAGISSNTWQTKIGKIVITVEITAAVRLMPVAMLLDGATVEPSPLCPDPSREKGRRRGDSTQDPPSLLPQLSASSRPPCPRQHRPTARRSRDQSPPACERGRRARCCSMRIARAPEPASFWTPSPPTLRPI
jgi:hypothetical protein